MTGREDADCLMTACQLALCNIQLVLDRPVDNTAALTLVVCVAQLSIKQ